MLSCPHIALFSSRLQGTSSGVLWNFEIKPVELNVWKFGIRANGIRMPAQLDPKYRKVMAPLDDGECESAADIDADDEGDENSSLLQWAETCRDPHVLASHWLSPSKLAFIVPHYLPFVPEASCISSYILFCRSKASCTTWGWFRACCRIIENQIVAA